MNNNIQQHNVPNPKKSYSHTQKNRKLVKTIADNAQFTYHYFNVGADGGVATVAIAHLEKNETFVYCGIGYCNPKDQFVKSTGRYTAKRKLFQAIHSNDLAVITTNQTDDYGIAKDVINTFPQPSWAQGKWISPRKPRRFTSKKTDFTVS